MSTAIWYSSSRNLGATGISGRGEARPARRPGELNDDRHAPAAVRGAQSGFQGTTWRSLLLSSSADGSPRRRFGASPSRSARFSPRGGRTRARGTTPGGIHLSTDATDSVGARQSQPERCGRCCDNGLLNLLAPQFDQGDARGSACHWRVPPARRLRRSRDVRSEVAESHLQTSAYVGLFAWWLSSTRLRRALDRIGRLGSLSWLISPAEQSTPCTSQPRLRAQRAAVARGHGALIVMERETGCRKSPRTASCSTPMFADCS